MQRIRNESDESDGDQEGTASCNPHSDHSDKERTPEFVAETLARIDNNPSESIRSVAKVDMKVSEFLIRPVVHEDIQYFSYKMRKGQFLLQAMKDKKEDRIAKLLNKLK